MNYCLFASKRWRELLYPNGIPEVLPSGLFQWIKVFDGEMDCPTHPKDLERYHVVHLNVPKNNIPYINEIAKNKPNHVKLVVNVDQSIDLWQTAFEHPTVMLRELDKADMIFSVESNMTDLISNYLKRKVYTIPHPVDIDHFSKLERERNNKKPVIGVLGHRYDINYTLPYFAINGIDCITGLFGYDKRESFNVGFYYDMINNRVEFDQYCKMISMCDICLETATTRSYGRSVVEAGALGVPVIGGSNVEAMKECFPKLISSMADTSRCRSLIEFLLDSEEVYNNVVSYAKEQIKTYSLEASKNKFLEALNE